MVSQPSTPDSASYTVVARRYRPKSFSELIGQDHIAHALGAAIELGRVGHAYLFTGARGVGKTSTARIFAKALNAGQNTEPELAADISHAIDIGEDMDVIEIDGASNRGIEEIRQLRANVNVRPSRARYKIYIIDEVHMLTNQAFNALLKTLEEPPGHVKFIFCTTDPDKIPVTVLSRCQRFDFVPVKLDAIQARLKQICSAEGYSADDDALALLARRAAGSLRDSQSLLEQVMSFSSQHITVEQVHQLLGIADEGRLLALSEALASHDALLAIQLVDEAMRAGADAGQLSEQLLNYLRDLMAVGIGGGAELLKYANPAGQEKLKEISQAWGVSSILSAIQILDESLMRMRTSISASALLEVALVQICQLSNLVSIPSLLDALNEQAPRRSAAGHATPGHAAQRPSDSKEKKNDDATQAGLKSESLVPERPNPSAAEPESEICPPVTVQPVTVRPVTAQGLTDVQQEKTVSPPADARAANAADQVGLGNGLERWKAAISGFDDMLSDYASLAASVECLSSQRWNIVFPPGAIKPREYCDQSERKAALQKALQQITGRPIQLSFSVMPGEAPKPTPKTPSSTSRVQKMREVAEHPFIKKICEVLDGEIIRIDPPAALAGPKSRGLTSKD